MQELSIERNQARISVIIPTFDRKDLVQRALDSVMGQSLPPFEIWVVDDGSSDGTKEMLKRCYPGVRILSQPTNQGVSAARNLGWRRACGNWIAFLDSDDTWQPNKLEKQMGALKASPHQICHTDEIWIRRGRRVNPMVKHQKRGGRIYQHCLPLCAISPSSVLIERSLLLESGGFDEALPACEDYDLWLRLTSRHPVLFVPEPLVVKYGGHEDQLSRKFWGMDRFRVRALEKILAEQHLSGDDRAKTLESLVERCEILANGALKRGDKQRADGYLRKADRFKREHRRDIPVTETGSRPAIGTP